jgi:hypothetical protein
MTVPDLLRLACQDEAHFQLHLNEFVDTFRAATAGRRREMIADGPRRSGRLEGLIAAVISALCRETKTPAPDWVAHVHSPEPFFVVPARGLALRLRLMLESPPPFRSRNVFVPENYLARA